MLKRFFAILAIALAAGLILCWIYLPSITRYRELRSEEDRLSQKIQEIDAQIRSLADERHLLQTDVAYLEKVIREELGFVKPGEIVYELVTKKNPAPPPQAEASSFVTSGKTGASVEKTTFLKKPAMSPAVVAGALAKNIPKSSKKKTNSSSRKAA